MASFAKRLCCTETWIGGGAPVKVVDTGLFSRGIVYCINQIWCALYLFNGCDLFAEWRVYRGFACHYDGISGYRRIIRNPVSVKAFIG